MTKEIENIVFYSGYENEKVITKACIFYKDGTYGYVSKDEGKKAVYNFTKQEKITSIQELNNNKNIHYLTEKDFLLRFNEFIAKKENTKEVEDKKEPPITNVEENKEEKQLPAVIEEKKKEDTIHKKGVLAIIRDLTKGCNVKKKTGKKYRASNIEIANGFKEELQSGNYLYNLAHVAIASMKVPFNLIRKAKAKITKTLEEKETIETIKERLSQLSEEDLMTLFVEYRGNRVNQERFPSLINILIEERLNEFVMGKVTKINKELEEHYIHIFSDYEQLEAIARKLEEKNISTEERENLLKQRKILLAGKAEEIAIIRELYVNANHLLSGGLHGMSEDMKAATTKLSCVGKRFAKDHDLDQDLLEKQAFFEDQENLAIAQNNDEEALKAFVAGESILSKNTEIKNSVFGKRSVGKKYYSPLAEMLDYRDDPFIRDLFTTIAITTATVNAVNSIVTHHRAQEMIDAHNQNINKANATNQATMHDVHQTGTELTNNQDIFARGMKAQSNQTINDYSGVIERRNLDANDWHVATEQYHQMDRLGHEDYTNLYETTQKQLSHIASDLAKGKITQTDSLDQLVDLSNGLQQQLVNAYKSWDLSSYIQSHPQFSLDAVQSTLQYVIKHPNAISNMNNAMVETVRAGENLAGLTMEQVQILNSLPSDLATNLIASASSVALATRVANEMNAKYKHKHYGNEITSMLDEFNEEHNFENEQTYTI